MVEKMKSKRASATAVAGKRAGAMVGIGDAVRVIKEEILRSRYRAARLANVELLMLYFRVGAYISANSRKGKWGTGAINSISNRLQQELPGLRGFSATNMKSMRLFFEAWFGKIVTSANRQLPTADLLTLPVIRQLPTAELRAGMFRPSYLGQLNFYLSALDEKVRRPDENPSVGLVLCEEANRRFVELAIRDVRKPIGVATYKTDRSVPPAYRRLVPLMNGVNEILEGR